MKNILICLVSISLLSCKQDVSVTIPRFSEKLVALSYIVNGDSSYIVYINKTQDPEQNQYWKYLDTSFVDAKVLLLINNIPHELDRMSRMETPNHSSMMSNSGGRFFILRKKVENISSLKLSVEYHGKKIVSSSFPLPTPEIDKVTLTGTLQPSGVYSTLKIRMEADFPPDQSYYYIQVIQSGYTEEVDSQHKIFHQGFTARGFFSSSGAGRVKEFLLNNIRFSSNINQKLCSINISRVEKVYFDFALAARAQRGEGDSFLPTETTEVPSNIEGGYGIFTVMNQHMVEANIQ